LRRKVQNSESITENVRAVMQVEPQQAMAVNGVAARTNAISPRINKVTEVAVTARAVDLVTSKWKHTEPAIELLTPEPPVKLPMKLLSCRMVSRRNKCFS